MTPVNISMQLHCQIWSLNSVKHPDTLSRPEQETAGGITSSKLLQLNSYVTTNPSSKSLNWTSIGQIGSCHGDY